MAILRSEDHITLAEAKENLLAWMDRASICFERPAMMSAMGYAAFPAARFKSPQGAALAVSRLAKQLINAGVITHSTYSTGYYPVGRFRDQIMSGCGCSLGNHSPE